MPSDTTALRRCVGDVDAFERDWGHRARHIPRSDATAFADVFDLDDVDELVSSSIRAPTLRMVRGGAPLPQTQYCSRLRLGGRYLDDVVDAAKVAAALRDGATLVLQSLHRVHPSVSRFVAELQDEIGHPVQANAYLTPPSAAGLAPHTDAHDVIVLQLAGTKSWTVEGVGDVAMSPGDSMYVPAGITHSAQTGNDFSLHLTLGVIRVTQRDLINRVLADLDTLDTPLPIGFRSGSTDALRKLAADALGASTRHLESVDPDDLVASEQRRTLGRPADFGRVSSMLRSTTVTGDTVIRWTAASPRARLTSDCGDPGPWASIETIQFADDDQVDVHVGERILIVPGGAVEAISHLAQVGSCHVDELRGLDEPSRLVVAERLLRETVCVIAESSSPGEYPD